MDGLRSNLSVRFLTFALVVAIMASWAPATLRAQTPAASTTQLAVISGGSTVTAVSAGSVVSLTATVTSGAVAVTTGQVRFCDASATSCLGLHQLALVSLNASGVAVYRFRPGPGSQHFKAVFAGTRSVASSSSAQSLLTVNAPAAAILATMTTMTRSGSWGSYTVGATVSEIGSTVAPVGTVSFLDTNHGNAVLGASALGTGTVGLGWRSETYAVPTGLAPVLIAATGDFNEDGIVDVATSVSNDSTQNNVAILLGNGDGTLGSPSLTPATGRGPGWVLVGDFNGDGHQDLAVQNSVDETVTILLGRGDGTFSAGSTFFISDALTGIVAGDFNGDGKTDLVAAGFNGTDITIYYGNGDGTFTLGSTVTFPVLPVVLVAADFNGDGKMDLMVGTQNQGVSVLLGNGDGTFTSAAGLTIPGYATSLLAGDFNGDGKLDIAVGNENQGATAPISIFVGNGDGTFSAVASGTSAPSASYLATADVNQDGIPDLVTSNVASSGVSVLLGKGDGTFTLSPSVAPTTGTDPNFTAVADLNGDGIPDLVTVNGASLAVNLTEPTVTTSTPTVTILPGAPGAHLVGASYPGSTLYTPSVSGTYLLYGQPPETATALTVTAGGAAVATTPANTVVTLTATVTTAGSPIGSGQVNFCDASAPGCTDIHLVGSAQLNSAGTAIFRFVPGTGSHTYKAVFLENALGVSSTSASAGLTVLAAAPVAVATTTAIAQSGPVGNYTLTATVNSIGGTSPMTGSVSFEDTGNANAVLASASLGTGTPSIGWVPTFTVTEASQNFLQFAGGDFNGDGHPDVAMINPNTMTVGIYLGHGDGTYTTAAPLTITTLTTGVVAADFNGDGILDLAVSSVGTGFTQPGFLTIYLGHGDGTFTLASSSPTAGNSAHVFATADVNGDGKLDLVVNEAQGVHIIFGNGDGTFAPDASNFPTTILSTAVVVADLNGDGIPDIVSGDADAYCAVYLGNGDGTFHAAAPLPLLMDEPIVSIGDFNGDGVPDMVLNSAIDGPFTILLGKGDGTFAFAPNQPTTVIGRSLANAVGDFNHDGKLDILVGTYTGNTDLNLFLGNGDGTFTPGPTDAQFYPAGAILTEDVNGDGTPDLIVDDGKMSVLLTEPTQTASATVTGVALSTAGTHPVDAVYAGDSNYLTSTSAATPLYAQTAAPTLSPVPGTYTSIQNVTLADATPGATIYYSLSGPTVGTGSFVPYTGAIPLADGGTYTLQLYATATGFQQSATSSATYILNLPILPTPTASPLPRAYSTTQTVTLSETTPGATIYYTLNGQFPTTSSNMYTGPLTVAANETILAYAVERGYTDSAAFYGQYVITAAPTIAWPAPGSIVYGTALSSTQLNASTTIPGTFTYSPAAGTVLTTGSHTLTATFIPTNTQSYPNATATVTLNVTSATPLITWPTPAAIPYGTALSAAQLNATTSVPGTFTFSPPAGSVLPVGMQTLTATFSPTDTTDYTSAVASVVLTVGNPAPVLGNLSPASVTAGAAAISLTVNGQSFVPTSVVLWGNTPLATQYVSVTQLTASVPASLLTTAGTASITVQTAAPGGGSSGTLQFELDSIASQGAVAPTFPTPTATVASGSPATYAVTLPGSVVSSSVNCLNLPASATCSYANGVVTITTAANTPPGAYVVTVVFTETLQGAATALFLLPFLLGPLAFKRSRSRRSRGFVLTLAVLTVLSGTVLLAGCGSAGSGGGSGTHEATSSATVTLIVQ